jgi:hypothetical protein
MVLTPAVLPWLPMTLSLHLIVKLVNMAQIGQQVRLGLQPMLHGTSGWRTLVQITKVCPSGHFLGWRLKSKFVVGKSSDMPDRTAPAGFGI